MEMPPNTQRTSEEWWQGEETQLQSEVAALTGFCADVIITNATCGGKPTAFSQNNSDKCCIKRPETKDAAH